MNDNYLWSKKLIENMLVIIALNQRKLKNHLFTSGLGIVLQEDSIDHIIKNWEDELLLNLPSTKLDVKTIQGAFIEYDKIYPEYVRIGSNIELVEVISWDVVKNYFKNNKHFSFPRLMNKQYSSINYIDKKDKVFNQEGISPGSEKYIAHIVKNKQVYNVWYHALNKFQKRLNQEGVASFNLKYGIMRDYFLEFFNFFTQSKKVHHKNSVILTMKHDFNSVEYYAFNNCIFVVDSETNDIKTAYFKKNFELNGSYSHRNH